MTHRPRTSFLGSCLLALVLLAGCDDGVGRGEAGTRIESGYYEGDGGFTYLPNEDSGGEPTPPTGDSDAGASIPASDASTFTPDGSVDPDAGATLDGDAGPAIADSCDATSCGAMPSGTFPCFDGSDARIECTPYLEGRCSWQFVCGP